MPDWSRIYPDSGHRWIMGLRRGQLQDFFVPGSMRVQAERKMWLSEEPEKDAAMQLPAAETPLAETVHLTRELEYSDDRAGSEHQLLLKFSTSGCILFGIRVEVVSLTEIDLLQRPL